MKRLSHWTQTILLGALCIGVLALSEESWATEINGPALATVFTTNVQGDPYQPDSEFTVDVAVRNNTQNPVQAYQFIITYNSDSAALVSVSDVDLGGNPPTFGPVFHSDTETTRIVGTLGNFFSIQSNLTMFRLIFQTTSSPAPSHGVTLSSDPEDVSLVDSFFQPIPHDFDNTETDPFLKTPPTLTPSPTVSPTEPSTPTITPTSSPTPIGPTLTATATSTSTFTPTITPTSVPTEIPTVSPTPGPTDIPGTAVIFTSDPQGGFTTGETFTVDVGVRNNTISIIAYFFRVHYDGDSVALIGIEDVDLGAHFFDFGPAMGSGLDTFRDVGTLGNPFNSESNLIFFRLTFEVLSNPASSIQITLSDPPGEVPLIGSNFEIIEHFFDLDATSDIRLSHLPAPVSVLLEDGAIITEEFDTNEDGAVDVADWLRALSGEGGEGNLDTLLNLTAP